MCHHYLSGGIITIMASPSTDSLIAINYVNLADILKDLKYYMKKIRRENGFDLSGPEKPWGEFTATKGGSYHYCYYQDKQLEGILDSYAHHREGKGYDGINTLLASRPTQLGRIKGLLERSTHDEIEESVANETTRLIFTIAQLLLEENGVFLRTLHPLVSSSSLCSNEASSSGKESNLSEGGSRKSSVTKLPVKQYKCRKCGECFVDRRAHQHKVDPKVPRQKQRSYSH